MFVEGRHSSARSPQPRTCAAIRVAAPPTTSILITAFDAETPIVRTQDNAW